MKKVLLIVASNGFQPIEYALPRQILEDENIEVMTASDEKNKAISSDGSEIKVDLILEDVNVNDYDGIFIIGGPGAMQHLDNERTYRIIREVDKKLNKIYGAICIAPRIIVNSDVVLDGRSLTGWNKDDKLPDILKEVGAQYVAENVVVDRNLITADGPTHAHLFGQAILKALYPQKTEQHYKPPF